MKDTSIQDRISVISFDGDGTLCDFEKVMRHALGCTLAELRARVRNQSADELTIDRMIAIRNSVADELKEKVTNLEQIRLQAFISTLEYIGYPDERLAEELNKLYLKHRFDDIELFADVLPMLDFLKERFTLGLLSNGNSYPDKCGLPDRFSHVLFSQGLGIEKPDPRIFLEFCKQAGIEPHQLIHIGDSLKNDVFGANKVGAISVWLNRNAEVNESGIVPDYEIGTLGEVKGILGIIEAG